jgi:hypothetical protein
MLASKNGNVRRDGGRAGTMGGSEVGAVAAGTARTLACSGHSGGGLVGGCWGLMLALVDGVNIGADGRRWLAAGAFGAVNTGC